MASSKSAKDPKKQQWKRSNPGVKRTVSFQSNAAKFAATHHFDSISKSLFDLDVVARARSKSVVAGSFDFKGAMEAVDRELGGLDQEISARNEQIKALLRDHKIDELVEYENPWVREVSIKTPYTLTALNVFVDFDKLNAYLDTAYLYRLTEKATVDELSNGLAAKIRDLAKSLHIRATSAIHELKVSHSASVEKGQPDDIAGTALAEIENDGAADTADTGATDQVVSQPSSEALDTVN